MPGMYLTLLGLYNWDTSVLDGLTLPEGIDADTFKTTLLAETAELELLYQNPELMKTLIAAWCNSMARPWERMVLALNEEYNPLHNYDRTEEWTDNTQRSGQTVNSNTRSSKVGGWNPGAGMADKEQITDSMTGSDSQQEQATRRGRAYGNIGVTTSATMLKEEIETRQRYNIYDIIVADFKSRFCILVY